VINEQFYIKHQSVSDLRDIGIGIPKNYQSLLLVISF